MLSSRPSVVAGQRQSLRFGWFPFRGAALCRLVSGSSARRSANGWGHLPRVFVVPRKSWVQSEFAGVRSSEGCQVWETSSPSPNNTVRNRIFRCLPGQPSRVCFALSPIPFARLHSRSPTQGCPPTSALRRWLWRWSGVGCGAVRGVGCGVFPALARPVGAVCRAACLSPPAAWLPSAAVGPSHRASLAVACRAASLASPTRSRPLPLVARWLRFCALALALPFSPVGRLPPATATSCRLGLAAALPWPPAHSALPCDTACLAPRRCSRLSLSLSAGPRLGPAL